MAEFYPETSPYRFANNNPNFWSDPTGLSDDPPSFHVNGGVADGGTFVSPWGGDRGLSFMGISMPTFFSWGNVQNEGMGNPSLSSLLKNPDYNMATTLHMLSPVTVEYKPKKSSFKFKSKGSYQYAGVRDMYFIVKLLVFTGVNVKSYHRYTIVIDKTTVFSMPNNLKIGNQTITNALAAELTANAVNNVMKQTSDLFGGTEATEMQVEQYFRQQLKLQYSLYIPGGRVNFNSMDYTGSVSKFEAE